MQAKLTRSEFLSVLNKSVGKQYDMDGFAAFQCVDYANFGWGKLFPGSHLAGQGAKDIPSTKWNDFTGKATVYKNTPNFLPQPGDLVVWGSQMGNGWGHVAWVVSATLNQIVVVKKVLDNVV